MGVFLGASSGWSGSSGRPSSRSAWKETRGRELLLNGLVSKPVWEEQTHVYRYILGSAKRWTLGCVNSPPRPEGARRRGSRNLGTTF